MVDINLYRSRIGNFNLSRRHSRIDLNKLFRKQSRENNRTSTNILEGMKMFAKLVLILVLIQPVWNLPAELSTQIYQFPLLYMDRLCLVYLPILRRLIY